jgi:hypothetical protein
MRRRADVHAPGAVCAMEHIARTVDRERPPTGLSIRCSFSTEGTDAVLGPIFLLVQRCRCVF